MYKNDKPQLSKLSGLQLWLASCTINGLEIATLEENTNNSGLYMTKNRILVKHNYIYETTYHVYINNKRLCSTTDYISAYTVWKNHQGDIEK